MKLHCNFSIKVIADPKATFVATDDSMEAVEGSSEPLPSSPAEEGVEEAREGALEAEKAVEESQVEVMTVAKERM